MSGPSGVPTDFQYVEAKYDDVQGVGPITKDLSRMAWDPTKVNSVLWARLYRTSAACLVVSKQGAMMFHYPMYPSHEELEERKAKEEECIELADGAVEGFRDFWEDGDGQDDLQSKFVVSRAFIFIPKVTNDNAHKKAIEQFQREVEGILKLTVDRGPKIVEFNLTAATGTAHVDVYWDGSDKIPRVDLNGKQETPAVPGFENRETQCVITRL